MAAVGQFLTQATQPVHVSCVSMHSEQSCFALIPKQASGFTTLAFLSRSSKTNAGQTETHTPQPSQVSRSILTLDISILLVHYGRAHFSADDPTSSLNSPNLGVLINLMASPLKFRHGAIELCAPAFIHLAASRKIGLGVTSITGMSNVPTLIEDSYSGIRANTTSVQ
jgi:hypothetical protein